MSSVAQPYWIDSHMHTPLCRHAVGWPEDYAEVALARGLKGITFTCHSPMPDGWFHHVRMRPNEFPTYVELIEQATRRFAGKLDIRLGLESDWFPGMEGWLEKLHAEAPFHHILGSVHWFGPEYQERFGLDDPVAFARQYFEHLAESAETGLFDTLAHPDLVKNASPETWSFTSVQESIELALDRIARTGVAMELNTSGRMKSLSEMNPSVSMLRLMQQRGIPVVIGSDSHRPGRVADGFEEALSDLEEAGYSEVSYFINRQRHSLPIAAAKTLLRPISE